MPVIVALMPVLSAFEMYLCLARYTLPLAELGGNFYDSLKSITSGYASFDYEEGELRKADLVRLDLLLNGEVVDALARVVHRCSPMAEH